jgi:hypothetical protein
MSTPWSGLTLFGIAVIVSCRAPAQALCTLIFAPTVIVEISDSATGAPLAEQARGLISDGSYSDSLRPYGSNEDGVLLSRQAGGERPGTYDVTVVHPGYVAWQVRRIRIGRDLCHVRTAVIRAKLKRLP